MNETMKDWMFLLGILTVFLAKTNAEDYSCLCTLSPSINSSLFWNVDTSNKLIVSSQPLTFNFSSPPLEGGTAVSWSIELITSNSNHRLFLMMNHATELEFTPYLPGTSPTHFTYFVESGNGNTFKFVSYDPFASKREIHWGPSHSSNLLTAEFPGPTFLPEEFLFHLHPLDGTSADCAYLMKEKRSCAAKLKSSNQLLAYLFANINRFDDVGSTFKLISPSPDSNYKSWAFLLLDNSSSTNYYLRANTNHEVYLDNYPISADAELFSFRPFFLSSHPGKIGFRSVKLGFLDHGLTVDESMTPPQLKLLPLKNDDGDGPSKYLFKLEDVAGETKCSSYFPQILSGGQTINSTVPAGVIGPACTLLPAWVNTSTHSNVRKATLTLKQSLACLDKNKSVVYMQKLFQSRVRMVDLVMAQNVSSGDVDDDEFSTMDMATGLEELGQHIAVELPVNESMDVNLPFIIMEISKQPINVKQYKFPRDGSTDNTHVLVEGDIFEREVPRPVVGAIYDHLEEEPHIVNVGSDDLLKNGDYGIDSKIISASVGSEDFHDHSAVNVTILLKHIKSRPDKRVCAFWQPTTRTSRGMENGFWSTRGCQLIRSNDSHTLCRCNHLTHFGILMELGEGAVGLDLIVLQAITTIGAVISLVSLSVGIIILTIILCGNSFNERFVIHMNLLIALALAQLLFISAIDKNENQDFCRIVAYSIHFLYLACFTWMLVEGVHLYLMVVKVFDSGRSKIAYYMLFAWGIPLLVVMVTVAITGDSYRATEYCWLAKHHGVIWSFVAPVMGIVFINIIITVCVMREIMKLSSVRQNSNLSKARAGARSVVLLLPLFGLTWVFGLLTFTNGMRLFQYLFTIFNTLQGFFVVLFHVILNSEVRKAISSRKRIFLSSYSDYFRKPSFTSAPRKPSSLSQASQNTVDSRTNLDLVTNLSTPLKQYPS